MVAYGRLKTKENVKLLVLKVVAVAEERWSLRRVSRKWRFDCTLYPVSLNSILVGLNNVKVSPNSTKVFWLVVNNWNGDKINAWL